MRELKFRAWTHQNPPMPWSQKFVAITGNGEQMIPIGGTFTGAWHVLGDDAEGIIIEQYTGLKDKNGNEIYEGDILDDGEGHIGKVLYNERLASFAYEWGNCGSTFMGLYTSDMEVIGNIHENPELLEEER